MSNNAPTPVPQPIAVTEDALVSARKNWSAHWKALSDSCRANPGVWYTLPEVPYKYASAIREGRVRVFTPTVEWEAKVHEKKLYVRWIGVVEDDS